MGTAPPRKQYPTLPPPRGRVKAQIFEGLAGNLSSAVSKAGRALAKMKRQGSASESSDSASASTSPPSSSYASDGYADHA
ncbi:hypothetical protein ACS0TY_020449 [Phlomoides rotata]